jgi:hypothetical protein
MKISIPVILALFFCSPSFGAEKKQIVGRKPSASDSIKGDNAKALHEALSAAGLGDCGAGTCEVEVEDLQCKSTGYSLGKRRFTCTYSDGKAKESIKGMVAKKIFEALKAVGLTGRVCEAGCETYTISQMKCLLTGSSVGNPEYNCSWYDVLQ